VAVTKGDNSRQTDMALQATGQPVIAGIFLAALALRRSRSSHSLRTGREP